MPYRHKLFDERLIYVSSALGRLTHNRMSYATISPTKKGVIFPHSANLCLPWVRSIVKDL